MKTRVRDSKHELYFDYTPLIENFMTFDNWEKILATVEIMYYVINCSDIYKKIWLQIQLYLKKLATDITY